MKMWWSVTQCVTTDIEDEKWLHKLEYELQSVRYVLLIAPGNCILVVPIPQLAKEPQK